METSPSRKFSFDLMFGSFILNCRQYGEYSDVLILSAQVLTH
ncbi:MAG: hypothetical protein ACTSRX_02975 [Promethearchaeota archaeon]